MMFHELIMDHLPFAHTAAQETPLLDAINRKLEESNFDCRSIASSESGAVVSLPPPAPKGPSQIERREDESVVTTIVDHLTKAENGDLVSGGGAKGAFTRAVFMYRTWDGQLYPSYVYRYDHFLDALRMMSTVGVDGELFYLGYGQEVQDDEEATQRRRLRLGERGPRRRRRGLQAAGFGSEEPGLGATDVSQLSLVYGLVNIAAFLAQAMSDSIIHDACDELNIDHLPMSTSDGIGLDDGNDEHRFPTSNACGQHGRSYQDEICKGTEREYDCVGQMNIDELAGMEARGTSRGQWAGAPGPFYCGPKDMYQTTGERIILSIQAKDLILIVLFSLKKICTVSVSFSGFWDAMVGREAAGAPSTQNDKGRTGEYSLTLVNFCQE